MTQPCVSATNSDCAEDALYIISEITECPRQHLALRRHFRRIVSAAPKAPLPKLMSTRIFSLSLAICLDGKEMHPEPWLIPYSRVPPFGRRITTVGNLTLRPRSPEHSLALLSQVVELYPHDVASAEHIVSSKILLPQPTSLGGLWRRLRSADIFIQCVRESQAQRQLRMTNARGCSMDLVPVPVLAAGKSRKQLQARMLLSSTAVCRPPETRLRVSSEHRTRKAPLVMIALEDTYNACHYLSSGGTHSRPRRRTPQHQNTTRE